MTGLTHEYVYSDTPVWGGGFNIVCKHCGEADGWAKSKSPVVLAEHNSDPRGPCPKRPAKL